MTRRGVLLVCTLLGAGLLPGCTGLDLRPVLSTAAVDAGRVAPSDSAGWYALGKDHLREGRLGQAVQAFQTALDLAPGSVKALNGLGASYDRLRRFDLADGAYLEALALAPSEPMTLNNLGWSRVMRGQPQLGIFYLRQALEESPDDPVMRANLQVAVTAADQKDPLPRLVTAAAPPRVPVLERRTANVVLIRTVPTVAGRPEPPERAGLDGIERASLMVPAPPAAAQVPQPAAPIAHDLAFEVSNGTGRARMARRFRAWFDARDVAVARLTNAARFDHADSVLVYRTAQGKAAAQRITALLPVAPRLVHAPGQRAGVRLILGADLLGFDRDLIRKGRNHEAISHAI